VRLLNSSIQVVAGEKGAESWGNFPHERERLYDLIDRTGASGVVFLTGDVHYAEISQTDEGPYPLLDFTSSPLAQYPTGSTGWEECINSQRISETYAGDNFGLVEIDWRAEPSPRIVLSLVSADGSVPLRHELSLDTLR
jgi:alkaline phosphatase D